VWLRARARLSARAQAFRLQPELLEQLQRLTESFVSEAVEFGVQLAGRRRGATLRPSDLALFIERTHHLSVPGFNKDAHPYRRPAASELHKARATAVRRAQQQQQQQHGGGGGEGGGG
jgi:transcription initiation factor TFIID subunit TAF12